jgi:hypothetical protein
MTLLYTPMKDAWNSHSFSKKTTLVVTITNEDLKNELMEVPEKEREGYIIEKMKNDHRVETFTNSCTNDKQIDYIILAVLFAYIVFTVVSKRP